MLYCVGDTNQGVDSPLVFLILYVEEAEMDVQIEIIVKIDKLKVELKQEVKDAIKTLTDCANVRLIHAIEEYLTGTISNRQVEMD